MNVQDFFYILASVYLVLGIVVLIVILGTIFYLIKRVNEISDNVSKRVEQEIKEIKEKPRLLASYIGHVVAKGIKNTMRDKMS